MPNVLLKRRDVRSVLFEAIVIFLFILFLFVTALLPQELQEQ
jgi:hypothetical protein